MSKPQKLGEFGHSNAPSRWPNPTSATMVPGALAGFRGGSARPPGFRSPAVKEVPILSDRGGSMQPSSRESVAIPRPQPQPISAALKRPAPHTRRAWICRIDCRVLSWRLFRRRNSSLFLARVSASSFLGFPWGASSRLGKLMSNDVSYGKVRKKKPIMTEARLAGPAVYWKQAVRRWRSMRDSCRLLRIPNSGLPASSFLCRLSGRHFP